LKVEQIVDLFREEFPRPSSELTHTWAVFWANFKIFLSYRTWVITETLSTVASIAMYSFMGLQVDANRFFSVGYGDTTWLAFAIIGIATANYLWMCISRISHSLQHEVAEGTLEPIVTSMIKLRSYIIGQSIRGFLVSSYFMIGALLIGVYVLNVPMVLTAGTILSFIVILVMMIVSYAGIGIMAAGIILVYKKGDPMTFLLASVTEFLGGVLFCLTIFRVILYLLQCPEPCLTLTPWTQRGESSSRGQRWRRLRFWATSPFSSSSRSFFCQRDYESSRGAWTEYGEKEPLRRTRSDQRWTPKN